jgi:hypothetical protein
MSDTGGVGDRHCPNQSQRGCVMCRVLGQSFYISQFFSLDLLVL